jgi:hypothetical protein
MHSAQDTNAAEAQQAGSESPASERGPPSDKEVCRPCLSRLCRGCRGSGPPPLPCRGTKCCQRWCRRRPFAAGRRRSVHGSCGSASGSCDRCSVGAATWPSLQLLHAFMSASLACSSSSAAAGSCPPGSTSCGAASSGWGSHRVNSSFRCRPFTHGKLEGPFDDKPGRHGSRSLPLLGSTSVRRWPAAALVASFVATVSLKQFPLSSTNNLQAAAAGEERKAQSLASVQAAAVGRIVRRWRVLTAQRLGSNSEDGRHPPLCAVPSGSSAPAITRCLRASRACRDSLGLPLSGLGCGLALGASAAACCCCSLRRGSKPSAVPEPAAAGRSGG